MSKIENTVWLENAYDNFKDAVQDRNWELAKEVIDDIAENGFTREAISLCRDMLTAKVSV